MLGKTVQVLGFSLNTIYLNVISWGGGCCCFFFFQNKWNEMWGVCLHVMCWMPWHRCRDLWFV